MGGACSGTRVLVVGEASIGTRFSGTSPEQNAFPMRPASDGQWEWPGGPSIGIRFSGQALRNAFPMRPASNGHRSTKTLRRRPPSGFLFEATFERSEREPNKSCEPGQVKPEVVGRPPRVPASRPPRVLADRPPRVPAGHLPPLLLALTLLAACAGPAQGPAAVASARAHTELAAAYYQSARYATAAAEAQAALHADPGYAAAHDVHGLVLMATGQLEAARAAFDRAVRLAPQAADARNNRAVLLCRIGRIVRGAPRLGRCRTCPVLRHPGAVVAQRRCVPCGGRPQRRGACVAGAHRPRGGLDSRRSRRHRGGVSCRRATPHRAFPT